MNTLEDIKEEFAPWIVDPRLLTEQSEGLYGCMIYLSRECKNVFHLHAALERVLFSLNNPYAWMTADKMSQFFGFNEGDSALCPVVLF